MTDNILAQIPGEYVSRAVQQLPPPDTVADDAITTQLDVPRIGRVLFAAVKKEARHHRSRHRFWSISVAMRVVE